MLKVLANQHKTIRYTEIQDCKTFVLWRHDCDMSLNRARAVAELDAQYGVRSTFFILPHSEFYNVLELSQTRLVREIINFGHDIGLHLDVNFHRGTQNVFNFEKAIEQDTKLLEDLAETKIDSFSFHNPTPEILEFDASEYSGLINCYSKEIRETIDYASDSNGYWRHRPIIPTVQKRVNNLKRICHICFGRSLEHWRHTKTESLWQSRGFPIDLVSVRLEIYDYRGYSPAKLFAMDGFFPQASSL
jgi:peptidoglycan/xylan/chitin deacetylase (PgdA/CDA1 family)